MCKACAWGFSVWEGDLACELMGMVGSRRGEGSGGNSSGPKEFCCDRLGKCAPHLKPADILPCGRGRGAAPLTLPVLLSVRKPT